MENAAGFWGVIFAAASAAVIHTLAGPDHYLPFIALAKCRSWSMGRTLFWTFVCGVGHVASALLLAVGFYYLLGWVTEEFATGFIDEHRGSAAAWMLIAFGAVYAAWGIRAARARKPHTHTHQHENGEEHSHKHSHSCAGHSHWHDRPATARVIPWILFIIFAFGPCEAVWAILPAATAVGTACLVASTLVFAAVTILTMMVTVALALQGVRFLNLSFFERYAHAIAGLAILLCGFAIAFLGL
ncbi:MAG: hypothetical protein FWG50_09265 [Kiritimatiellaeota bacterium]|nr:hypothetical protein [Kiritimatiellota bacterium]